MTEDWIKLAKEIQKQQGFKNCINCKNNKHCWGRGIRCNCKCPTQIKSNNLKKNNQEIKKKDQIRKRKEISDDEFKKQFEYENSYEISKENECNKEFFDGIKDNKNETYEDKIYQECEILIKNYKRRNNISEHNVNLIEDMIEAYQLLGTLKKLCQEIDKDIIIIREGFRNLLRVPVRLKEMVLEDKLTADPILATEIAIYATDYYEWDQEEIKTNDVITLAKNMADMFNNTLNLRKEFFATNDDYSKPITVSSKKNNELNVILEDWPVKKSKYEFNKFTDRSVNQYRFIVFYSKDLDAARFVRRWEYEKGRRISKRWASEIIDQIKNQGHIRGFLKEHSNEFND